MSKLSKLKHWLTVPDAAKHLSIAFGEDVSEADILRLALDRKLRLSIRFVNEVPAMSGTVGERQRSKELEALTRGLSEMNNTPFDDKVFYSTSIPLTNRRIDETTKYFTHQSRTGLTEVWDLPMIGDEEWEIEHRYQMLTGGPAKAGAGHEYGSFVEGPDGTICCLVTQNDHPLFGLPEDGVIVVRTEALREFERAINCADVEVDKKVTTTDRAHVSYKLAILNQAATRFWSNADPADRGTHPDNATVSAWLEQHKFTPTLAAKATTIIRPEWAPAGRKPEE